MPRHRSRHQISTSGKKRNALPNKTHLPTIWWTVGIPAVAIVGAVLGYFFLSSALPVLLRVLLGAFMGSSGLILLLLFFKEALADPKAAIGALFNAGMEGCQIECCLYFAVFFIAFLGMVSALLLSHMLLLAVVIGR